VKPRNKQELVDGIKKFWRKKVTPKKCGKYIDHVLHKAIPAVVEAQGTATKHKNNGSFRSHSALLCRIQIQHCSVGC